MMKHLNEIPLPLTTASLGKDYPSTPLTAVEQQTLKKRLPTDCLLIVHDNHI